MGNQECCEAQKCADIVRDQPTLTHHQTALFAQQLCTESKVVIEIGERLNDLVCTDIQLDRLATIALDILIMSQEQRQSQRERDVVKKIFSDQSIILNLKKSEGQQGALLYHDIIDLVKKEMKLQPGPLSEGCRWRIYHSTANAKQEQFVKTKGNHHSGKAGKVIENEQSQFEYKFKGVKMMDEMVRMEEMAVVSRHKGKEVQIQLDQLRQSTASMLTILKETELHSWQYDFSKTELLAVAKQAYQATQINHSGVILLITYLKKAMNQRAKEETTPQVEDCMEEAIQYLRQLYPPGHGLKDHLQSVHEAFKKLQITREVRDEKRSWDYDALRRSKQAPNTFTYQPIMLSGFGSQRLQQVRQYILYFARIAEQHYPLLERIIRKTCLKRAVSFSASLKLYPGNINEKALERIQEKMFLGTQNYKIQLKRNPKPKLQDSLKEEQKVYKDQLAKLFTRINQVMFTVEDMLRGRCKFTSVKDIIQTVREIKRFCQKHPKQYRIIEIESCFTFDVPISDVTLKIVVKEQIVSELQLTLQTDAAAYQLAHTIHEISQSKIFSKCKMVDNKFKQHQSDISEMINRALELKGDQAVPSARHYLIRQAFGVEVEQVKKWRYAVQTAIQTNPQLKRTPSLKDELRVQHEDLLVAIISLQSRRLKQHQLRHIAKQILASEELPKEVKAVVFQEVFFRVNLAADLKSGYFNWLGQYSQTLFEIQLPQLFRISENSCVLQSYMRQFSTMLVINNSCQIDFKPYSCIVGKSKALRHQLRFMIHLVDAIAHLQRQDLEVYAQQLLKLLEQQDDRADYRLLKSMIKLRLTENCISQGKVSQSLHSQFQQIREHLVGEEALLVEWAVWNIALGLLMDLDAGDDQLAYENYKANYESAAQTSRVSLFQLNTPQNAAAHHLIATKLQALAQRSQDRLSVVKASKEHYSQLLSCGMTPRMVMKFNLIGIIMRYPTLTPAIKTNQSISQIALLQKDMTQDIKGLAKLKWPSISTLILEDCKIDDKSCEWISKTEWSNLTVINLTQNYIKNRGCQWFSHASWPRLKILNLSNNQIEEQGCRWLSCSKWPQLKTLKLSNNIVGAKGVEQLRKGNWPQLQVIRLSVNIIRNKGCEWFIKANWPNLSIVNLKDNQISQEGCRWLSRRTYPKLTKLVLSRNKIRVRGCEWLSQVKWPSLKFIDLSNSEISDQSCEWIKRASWQGLEEINLSQNQIGSEGCGQICRAEWPNIKILHMGNNLVGQKGCMQLSQGRWQKLNYLDLAFNSIGKKGCEWLSKSVWPNLKTLILGANYIKDEGCLWLIKANWPSLETLDLRSSKDSQVAVILRTQAVSGSAKQAGHAWCTQIYVRTMFNSKAADGWGRHCGLVFQPFDSVTMRQDRRQPGKSRCITKAIDIWGAEEDNDRHLIHPENTVMISYPLSINSMATRLKPSSRCPFNVNVVQIEQFLSLKSFTSDYDLIIEPKIKSQGKYYNLYYDQNQV